MGANRGRHLILTHPSLAAPPSLSPIPLIHFSNPTSASGYDSLRCNSRPDIRKPIWDASGTHRSKFYPYTELYGDDEDADDEDDDGVGMFGFRQSKNKQRAWWSDDADVDDSDDDDEEFWGFKMLKVFGWMVPAILISILLGTGSNALFMAVALPLAQTALSLAIDKVWGTAGQTSKPMSRNRNRSKPFRSTDRARKRKQDADFSGSRESTSTSSPSSTQPYDPARVNGQSSYTSFGGWDELDRDVKARPDLEEGEQKQHEKRTKASKRVRNRGSPLLIRLLVAVFPILGSWARFL